MRKIIGSDCARIMTILLLRRFMILFALCFGVAIGQSTQDRGTDPCYFEDTNIALALKQLTDTVNNIPQQVNAQLEYNYVRVIYLVLVAHA